MANTKITDLTARTATTSTDEIEVAAGGSSYRVDLQDILAPPSATAPTLLNSWVNHGAPNAVAGYRKVGKWVTVQGLVKDGTLPGVIFQLPAGYRPSGTRYRMSFSNGAAGGFTIAANGDVTAQFGSNAYFSLECGFWAD